MLDALNLVLPSSGRLQAVDVRCICLGQRGHSDLLMCLYWVGADRMQKSGYSAGDGFLG